MPTALATTKRKFTQLLDSISSTSLPLQPDSNAATQTPTTTPAKRPKTSTSQLSPYVRSTMPASATTATTLRTPLKPTPSASTVTITTPSKSSTNYAPWDRTHFLQRLETFRHVDKWMSKPDIVNEVQWAKRGWSCVGKEHIRCVEGCEKELVIGLEEFTVEEDSRESASEGDQDPGPDPDPDLPQDDDTDDWRDKAYNELVQKYAGMIASEHEGSCLWRRKGCDETIHRLPLSNQGTAASNLQSRYKSLLAIKTDLPTEVSYPSTLDLVSLIAQVKPLLTSLSSPSQAQTSQDVASQATSTEQNPSQFDDIHQSALLLALFGWQAESEHISGLISCNACFRRLGLWLFHNPSFTAADDTPEAAMTRLDIASEHRDYCPWINALSQSEPSSLTQERAPRPGWEILREAIKNSSRRRSSELSQPVSPAPAQEAVTVDRPVSGGSSITYADSASVAMSSTAADTASRDEKDKERWARLKRLTQAFNVKRDKGKIQPAKDVTKSKRLSQILLGGKR